MDQIRDVCSAASSLRKAKKAVRLLSPPGNSLWQLRIRNFEGPFVDLIGDEFNVK